MPGKKSVRSLAQYEALLRKFQSCRLSVSLPLADDLLQQIGLDEQPSENDSFLPAAVGKISDFNAYGTTVVRKDLPKVTESRSSFRTWQDWHGYEHSGIQTRTYEVYQRDLVLPPSEYLTVLAAPNGLAVCSRPIKFTEEATDKVLHVVNLFLELFGKFQVFDEAMGLSTSTSVKHLNWKLLPPGKYPFARTKEVLSGFLSTLKDSDRPVVEERIKAITKFEPDFLAVGVGGFRDYVVFGFTGKNRYVLESPRLGNATYIFDHNWQELSTKTKKEILDGSLHEARVIHGSWWYRDINTAINKKGA
ncbi:MAG TPA: hypothetical protein VIT92_06320 [Burkholderiaceae bacterium]